MWHCIVLLFIDDLFCFYSLKRNLFLKCWIFIFYEDLSTCIVAKKGVDVSLIQTKRKFVKLWSINNFVIYEMNISSE